MAARDYKSVYWFGKLTWSPTNAHRLTLQAEGDPTIIKNVAQDPYTLPLGEQAQAQGGFSITASHIWSQGSKGVLQSTAYFQKSYIRFFSMSCLDASDKADCIRNLQDPWLGSNAGDFNGGEFPYGEISDRYRI